MTQNHEQLKLRRKAFQDSMASFGVNRAVIVTGSFRAGTSYICSLLANNGMKGIRLEKFAPLDALGAEPDENTLREKFDEIFSTTTDGLFVSKIMWPHRNALARILGIGRAGSKSLTELLPSTRWINVIRKDKVEQAISFWKAKETSQWQIVKKEELAPEPLYNFQSIRKCFVELSAHDMLWKDFHTLAETEVQDVIYENFVDNVEHDLPVILNWLNDFRIASGTINLKSHLQTQRNEHSEKVKQKFMSDLYKTGF